MAYSTIDLQSEIFAWLIPIINLENSFVPSSSISDNSLQEICSDVNVFKLMIREKKTDGFQSLRQYPDDLD